MVQFGENDRTVFQEVPQVNRGDVVLAMVCCVLGALPIGAYLIAQTAIHEGQPPSVRTMAPIVGGALVVISAVCALVCYKIFRGGESCRPATLSFFRLQDGRLTELLPAPNDYHLLQAIEYQNPV